jgi:hypothetical protein
MKTCFKCKVAQSLDQFYAHPMMADGRLGKCKECTKKDVRDNRARRRDYYNEYDRARAKLPAKRESLRRSIKKHHHKEVTRRKTWAAIKSGRLIRQPCQVCGATKSEGHHPDYSDPLNVLWLCRAHHVQEHMRLNQCQP